jgi:hypothetical protein
MATNGSQPERTHITQEANKMTDGSVKRRNFVAKHCRSFNLATVQTDRKKATKRGYRKHRSKAYE